MTRGDLTVGFFVAVLAIVATLLVLGYTVSHGQVCPGPGCGPPGYSIGTAPRYTFAEIGPAPVIVLHQNPSRVLLAVSNLGPAFVACSFTTGSEGAYIIAPGDSVAFSGLDVPGGDVECLTGSGTTAISTMEGS